MQKLLPGFFYCLLASSIPVLSQAQSTTLGDRRDLNTEQSLQKEKAKRAHTPKKRKSFVYKRPKVRHTAQYEFYARVEQAAKDRQRLMRKMDAPQFSNPLYYGHKRPPKKRPPHKMRYCKECGIRH